MSDTQRPFPIPVVSDTAFHAAREPDYAEPTDPIPGIRDVVLVASGKGGVGKSTVTINLACALAAQGQRVGVVDADLYGPSVARMLGTDQALELTGEGRVIPATNHGVHAVSVANVLPPEAALVWKGPLVAQALVQMFREVAWPELDILLVDLPPGTGDVQLTILEQIPVSGTVIVTTPQRLALSDVERGISLFHDLDIPVFGVIENMSHYVCPCCGEEQPLFPSAGADRLAGDRHVRFLGQLPLDPEGQELADSGEPLVISRPEGAVATAMRSVARSVLAAVEQERRYRETASDPALQAEQKAMWEELLDEEDNP
ncbi:MAG: hypothetical protein Kow006_00350 [Gammaproteobacteria bacterium]